VTTASSVQFDFFRSPLAFLLPVSICLWACSLVRLNLHPGVAPNSKLPFGSLFSEHELTRLVLWCRNAVHSPSTDLSLWAFSSRVVLDSPCSFCLHDFSCTDFYCRFLISGFRASRARSGFGFLSSPLCFLVCVRSLPPESCSLPFHFWNLGFSFLAFSGPLVCSYWTSLSCSRWIFPFRATTALVFLVPAFRIQSTARNFIAASTVLNQGRYCVGCGHWLT
jgi:hypothetical protein